VPQVLLISHYFWPEPLRINQVVEDLIAAGAKVTVLTGHPSYPEEAAYPGYRPWRMMGERHPAGYEIFRVPVVPRGRANGVRLAVNYLSFVGSAIVFGTPLLRRRRFDVVFVFCTTPAIQGYAALWFGVLKKAKVVLWVQDIWPQSLAATGYVKSPTLLRLVGRVVRALYRRCDLILGQSRAFVRLIEAEAGGVPVRYFPNPGEHPTQPASPVAVTLPEKFNVIFAGNLGKAQAMETIVEAARILRENTDIHITLFGSGAMGDWIAGEIAAGGLHNLALGGRLPPEAMPEIYRKASALLLTLVNDEIIAQTVPSKLQSYLGAGRPIIAAVNGEAAAIVSEAAAGFSCRAEDPTALAEAIVALKNLPELSRREMGDAARRYFDANYMPEALARQLLAHLDGVAAADEPA